LGLNFAKILRSKKFRKETKRWEKGPGGEGERKKERK
jgi:hypothetical protein